MVIDTRIENSKQPEKVISASSINSFKNEIDKYLREKYGVNELELNPCIV